MTKGWKLVWYDLFVILTDATIFIVFLRSMTPILLTALGGLISDVTGVTNIGLEGLMLISAFSSIAVGSLSNSWLIGVLSGVLVSMIISYIMGFFHLKMKVNIIITGFAVNIFGAGVTVFLMKNIFEVTGSYNPDNLETIPTINIPFIKEIPLIGSLLNGHSLMVWIGLISVVFCYYMLYKTPYGVHLRAIGEAPESARSLGIAVRKLQYSAFVWSGVFAGLAGSFMSMGMTSMFVKDMTAGTGFLALAVVLLGNRNPIGIFIGSAIFGLSKTIETLLQTIPNSPIPSQFAQVFPYVVTIIALMFFALRNRKTNSNLDSLTSAKMQW